jgi:hypothetical protein
MDQPAGFTALRMVLDNPGLQHFLPHFFLCQAIYAD